jgi:hypothetical protein
MSMALKKVCRMGSWTARTWVTLGTVLVERRVSMASMTASKKAGVMAHKKAKRMDS